MTWNDLRASNKTYDNPSAFNASCTFGRAFMRSMKALTFGKCERSNSTRGAQRDCQPVVSMMVAKRLSIWEQD